MSDLPPPGTENTGTQVPLPPYLQAPAPSAAPSAQANRWRWVPLTIVIVIVAGSAIAVLGYLGWNLGPQAFTIGLIAALLPVPVLVGCFLWLDRYEPEPPLLLAGSFLWGAFPAAGLALVVNTAASKWLGLPDTVVATVVAPMIEETGKALGPLLILWFARRQISGITDGIVYCGLSGVGFAMVENILYLGGHGFHQGNEQYGPASGAQLVFAMFIGRILMSGFAHPLFTSMTGIGIGLAARSASAWVRWCAPIGGLLVAMMLHGSWNLMATLSASVSPYFFLYGYIAVMVPVFLTAVSVALWVRAREGRLAAQVLPAYAAAGWLTPPEVESLGTLGRRHAARVWAKRVAGDAGHRAMRDFQFAGTRLAVVRDGLSRGLDTTAQQRERSAQEEQRQLEAMSAARQVYIGRDPQTPSARWDGRTYQLVFPDQVVRPVPAPPEPVVPIAVILPPAPVYPYSQAGQPYPQTQPYPGSDPYAAPWRSGSV